MIKKLLDATLIAYFALLGFVFVGGLWQKFHQKPVPAVQTPATTPQSQPTPPAQTSEPAPTQSSTKTFSQTEVATHNNAKDCWLIIDNKVYDVTQFLREHPGGIDMIMPYCGKEASEAFHTKGGTGGTHSSAAEQLKNSYYIGDLK